MKQIFEYSDYREFIRDFYLSKKEKNRAFSYRLFADKAGFKAKSFIQDVISGKKNVSDDSIEKLQKVMKLSEEEFAFFNDLVCFNQGKTVAERELYIEKLDLARYKHSVALLRDSQYRYFTRWYHNAIREIICSSFGFSGDYEALGRLLSPQISSEEAKESVELLLELGLVVKKGVRYEHNDALLTTGDEVSSLAVAQFHEQNLLLARDKIEQCDSAERDISTIVVGLSDEGYKRYKEEVQRFRKELLKIADKERTYERIYHVNFQLIPVSESMTEEKDHA